MDIMKARKKAIRKTTPLQLGVDLTPKVLVKGLSLPPTRMAGRRVAGVGELILALREEAKII
jgi:electron transfer flavoprotein beta subunit